MLGILSLVTWSLIMVVAVKYVSLVMRADNKGEGGIMALMALAQRAERQVGAHARGMVMLMALLGAALFFGDGVITPSISVLSAVEGLEVAAPAPGALGGADDGGRAAGPVLAAAPRHGQGRRGVRAGDACCGSSRSASIGVWNIIQAPGVLRGAQSAGTRWISS